MNVWVTGSHGLIGSALVQALVARGDTATPVQRDGTKLRVEGLQGADALVHLAGAGIGDKRWTEQRKRELLETLPPYQGGGEMIEEVTRETVTYNQPPHRFEAGTPPIVQAIGLGAAIDYVGSIGKARIQAHEAELSKYAHQRLREINSLRIFGAAREKGAIVSFEMKGAHPHDVATVIDRQGIAVRAGTHCVMPLLERFNVTATCRASFGMYNTREEVDQLVHALIKARELFA